MELFLVKRFFLNQKVYICVSTFKHNMGNLTLKVSDDLQKKMKRHSEIRWSEVVRKSIEKKINDLELLDTLTNKSKLNSKNVLEISKKIDGGVARRLGLVA
jgi:predicted CopG family antitoxin